MVKAHESWIYRQHSAWQLPDLNCMRTSLDPRQPECLPSLIAPENYMFSANAALPGYVSPGFANLKTEQINGAHKALQILPPRFQNLVPSPYPYLNEIQPAFPCGFSEQAAPNEKLGSLQKGLLVFDQSGNQTQLVYSSVCPSVLNTPATLKKEVSVNGFLQDKSIKRDQFTSVKPLLHEEFDENHISGKECEMHEDTEEINALLYSDGDDDYSNGDDSEDDEVKSTDHSPVAIEGKYEKHDLTLEISEEVASSDGPNKRQKLLNGGYNKSSQTDTACSVQLEGSHECDNDAESGYANGQTQKEEVDFILGNMQSRKDKIHTALRILQGIIPGANGKDPLSLLDEAIDYLQSLKLKAVALGV